MYAGRRSRPGAERRWWRDSPRRRGWAARGREGHSGGWQYRRQCWARVDPRGRRWGADLSAQAQETSAPCCRYGHRCGGRIRHRRRERRLPRARGAAQRGRGRRRRRRFERRRRRRRRVRSAGTAAPEADAAAAQGRSPRGALRPSDDPAGVSPKAAARG